MKAILRHMLWRWLGRDCLVLRPDWAVLSRTEDHILVGPRLEDGILPVLYNQQTSEQWQLHYRMRGHHRGHFHYTLAAPGKEPFLELNWPAQLPHDWSLELRDGSLWVGPEKVPLVPGRTLPLDTVWLTAELSFQPEQGPSLSRRTSHRVRFTSPRDEDYFTGAVYEDYDRQTTPHRGAPLEILRKFGPLRGRLLDVGCATGLLVEDALHQGLDAEGIDFSAWAVEQANQRTDNRCRQLNLDEATPQDFSDSYQLIVFQSVLEHLSDPARALQLLYDILAPGGMLYVQTLNADSLCHRLLGSDWSGLSDPTHRSPWITADWLDQSARTIGFHVLQLRRYGLWHENKTDPVWRSFQSALQLHPACVLLEDHYGDFVEAVLKK